MSVAIQHINGGAAMPSTLNPNIPGGLEQIIMRSMALEIEDRYTTASQMLHDMDEFRKDPTMLFDYNVPPLDAVIKISRPPIPMTPPQPKTTAQKVAGKNEPGRSKTTPAGGQPPRRTSPEARRKKEEELRRQKNNRMATIAIISCALVAVVALVIFLITLFNGSLFSKPQKLLEVPTLVGQMYGAGGISRLCIDSGRSL